MPEIEIDQQGRPQPRPGQGEEMTLLDFLEFQRATFEWKCRGLSTDQLRTGLSPTSMTLAGMLKHLAYVEDYWFTGVVAGRGPQQPWAAVDWTSDPDWEWRTAWDETGYNLRALWADRVMRSRTVVDEQRGLGGALPLGKTHLAWDGRRRVSLRWVLTHMIEEYARHNGHADLIREAIDGQKGE